MIPLLILLTTNNPEASVQNAIPGSDKKPPIKKIGENVFQIENLVVDANINEIHLNGWVNMSEGMIELLACSPGGKIHESVLVLDVNPVHLQIALLLLGLECSGNLESQGDVYTPRGDSVDIFVQWDDPKTNEHKSVRGEDLVYNISSGKPMNHTHWIFTGSRILDNTFMASIERSLVTTYHDPNTILDNPLSTGADDTVYEVNKLLVPEKGTKVKVIIKPHKTKLHEVESG